jgi:hypothetical protein
VVDSGLIEPGSWKWEVGMRNAESKLGGSGFNVPGLKKSQTARIKGFVFSSVYKSVSLSWGITGIPDFD